MTSGQDVQEEGGFQHPLFVDDPQDKASLALAVEAFKHLVEDFEGSEQIKIRASSTIFADLITAFSRDIKKLRVVDHVDTPSEYKVAGLLAFWVRKLKPLQEILSFTGTDQSLDQETLRLFLNEQFALNLGLSAMAISELNGSSDGLRSIILSTSYSDILSHLRYRAISPQAMALFYKMLADIRISQEEAITKLVSALGYRDEETGEHVKRIGIISQMLADWSGLPQHKAKDLYLAAIMHDIGKVAIPDKILCKPDRLTESEYEVIKTHPGIGARILDNPYSPVLRLAQTVTHYHHERWDGKGYPHGLAGEEIPQEARIVAVADAFDAMMSKRVYRPALSREATLEQINDQRSKQFDPTLCDIFIDHVDEIMSL